VAVKLFEWVSYVIQYVFWQYCICLSANQACKVDYVIAFSINLYQIDLTFSLSVEVVRYDSKSILKRVYIR
jgi:hypothetical protein